MNARMHTGSPWRVALLLMLVAGTTLPATAQTAEDAIRFTERSPATGPRLIGMAGAGIAGTADNSAFFNNPAGLGYFQQSAVSGAFNAVYATDQSFYQTPGFSSRLDEDISKTHLGNLSYIYRAPTRQGSFVIGAAYNQVHSFERDLRFVGQNAVSTISTSFLPFDAEFSLDGNDNLESLDDLPFAAFNGGMIEFFPEFLDEDPNAYPFLEAVVPGKEIEQSGSVIESGRMNEVSLGGAVEAAQGVMLGFSTNLVFGEYNFTSVFEEADVFNENTGADYSVLLDDGSLLEGFDFLSYRQFLESNFLGVNARAGVSVAVGPSVRVGASLETPTYYDVNESFGMDFETVFDDGGVLRYGDQIDDVGNGEFEYRIITPWRLSVGVGFHTDNVTVLADAEVVDWSQLEFKEEFVEDRGFFDELNLGIQEDYTAVVNGRLGLEYRLGDLMLRGGVAYQPDPFDLALRKADGSSLERDKLFFSAGLGYRFQNRVQVDFGWMQGRFDSIYAAYPEDSLGARQDDTLLVDEEVVQNQIVLGLSFFF